MHTENLVRDPTRTTPPPFEYLDTNLTGRHEPPPVSTTPPPEYPRNAPLATFPEVSSGKVDCKEVILQANTLALPCGHDFVDGHQPPPVPTTPPPESPKDRVVDTASCHDGGIYPAHFDSVRDDSTDGQKPPPRPTTPSPVIPKSKRPSPRSLLADLSSELACNGLTDVSFNYRATSLASGHEPPRPKTPPSVNPNNRTVDTTNPPTKPLNIGSGCNEFAKLVLATLKRTQSPRFVVTPLKGHIPDIHTSIQAFLSAVVLFYLMASSYVRVINISSCVNPKIGSKLCAYT